MLLTSVPSKSMANGAYFDGKSAKKHAVHVSLVGMELTIQTERGERLATWPLAEVSAAYEDKRTSSMRLRLASASNAVLIIEDHSLVSRIEPYLPRAPQKRTDDRFTWLHAFGVICATAIVAALLYFTLPLLTRPIADMVPIEWEKKIGVTVVDSIPGANRFCNDGSGQESLTKLTQSLSRVMDLPYPVSVTVARMDLRNAFAAPGGFIVIGQKLIAEMESPDEFAGVLAHEMAHIAERHPISRLIHVFGIGIVFELMFGGDAAVVEALLEGTSLLLFLSHSRDDEREADKIARESLIRAGYSTGGLTSFFVRMQSAYGSDKRGALGQMSSWLSTHPSFAERIASSRNQNDDGGKSALSDAEWFELKSICGNNLTTRRR